MLENLFSMASLSYINRKSHFLPCMTELVKDLTEKINHYNELVVTTAGKESGVLN